MVECGDLALCQQQRIIWLPRDGAALKPYHFLRKITMFPHEIVVYDQIFKGDGGSRDILLALILSLCLSAVGGGGSAVDFCLNMTVLNSNSSHPHCCFSHSQI